MINADFLLLLRYIKYVVSHLLFEDENFSTKLLKDMRSRTSTWFETRVRYDKTMEDGQTKKVIEQYVVDAVSFSEAEVYYRRDVTLCEW